MPWIEEDGRFPRLPSESRESRTLVARLDASRSTAQKKDAVRQFKSQVLRDERFRDSHVPNYVALTGASPIEVLRPWLRRGWNILGVQTAGAVTVRLPFTARKDQIITVKDERGTAGTSNITIEVYTP